MAIVWLLLGAALVLLISSFGGQNAAPVNLTYFGYTLLGIPLWLVLLVPAMVGLLLGFLMGVPGRVRAALTQRRLNAVLAERDRTVGALQQRVAELERDVAVARRPAPVPLPVEEPPGVPDGATRPHAQAA